MLLLRPRYSEKAKVFCLLNGPFNENMSIFGCRNNCLCLCKSKMDCDAHMEYVQTNRRPPFMQMHLIISVT